MTIQEPESLMCDRAIEPQAMARTRRGRGRAADLGARAGTALDRRLHQPGRRERRHGAGPLRHLGDGGEQEGEEQDGHALDVSTAEHAAVASALRHRSPERAAAAVEARMRTASARLRAGPGETGDRGTGDAETAGR